MHNEHKLKVAVVDDDLLMLDMMCSMLQALGYQAMPFESALALAEARSMQAFHALMLDLSMPEVDGFELIYQLVDRQSVEPVEPVIIISSLSHDIRQAAKLVCESLGIVVLGVLSKPFSRDELSLLLATRQG